MKYLGLDYGLKRIGIAISDESYKYAFQRDYITNNNKSLSYIINLINTEKISKVIIGYPLNFNMEKTHITDEVLKFSQNLITEIIKNNLQCNVELFDERLTSNLASYNLSQSGLSKKKKRDKGIVDSISAQIILQDYLDKNKVSENESKGFI